MTGWPQDNTDEWRLRRGVIVRWVHSWFIQRGITELPDALADLPPLKNTVA
ncbi:hypothetical protein [Streptomyces sp. NPDC127112]|uniref:hypothetical protein n=1 Tax=Streptomyces sp. NPDC127112 TaxID=3345364 RepID=UPI003625A82A